MRERSLDLRVTTAAVIAGLVGSLLGGCGASGGPAGDADALRRALSEATPGDTVELGAGEFRGAFEVPAGVALVGQGPELTRVVGPSDAPALQLRPGASVPTEVANLTVASGGDYALTASGAGGVSVEGVEILASAGAGIGVEDVGELSLTDVQVRGPVTPDTADTIPPQPDPSQSATHGVVVLRVDRVQLERLEVSGFADVGVLLVDSGTRWMDGAVRDNLGTGLLVWGGDVELVGVALRSSLQGVRLSPAYNGVFAGEASVTSDALEVDASEGFGLLHAAASASHDGLDARDNASAAVWIQDSTGVRLTNGLIADNALAGVAAVNSEQVLLEGMQISGTRPMTRIFESRSVQVGDGLHLLRAATDVTVRSSTLAANARVGILLDVDADGLETLVIEDVTVEGTGEQLGAVAQGPAIPAAWDDGITRVGAPEVNDPAFTGILDTLGIVGPSDLPAVGDLAAEGIGSITGPSD